MKWSIIKVSTCIIAMWLFAECKPMAKQTATAKVPQDSSRKITVMDSAGNDLLRLKEKIDAGIDFIASGTEPFWSLEIDFDKQMHFKTAGGFEITTPVSEGVKAMDARVVRYRAQTEGGEMIVQLAHRECINNMSGAKSEYSVSVETKHNIDKNYTRYEGCGIYTADYRLNDIWVLERVNETTLKREDFIKGLPQLEISLAQRKVFGHTGCNNLNGAAEVQGKKISFSMFMTTRMACPNIDFENRYLASLQRRTIPYKIDSGKLQLQVGSDSVYTYHKID